MSTVRIQPYEVKPAAFLLYDERWPRVASILIEAIENRDPLLRAEHVGSTSVPECGGKGVIDLVVTYTNGDLDVAKAALAKLGFQPQHGRDPFPESRPMREGCLTTLGSIFRVHVHVIERDCEEHRQLVAFRDALRSDPSLRRAYEADKQRILASGVTDSLDYCYAKGEFITSTLSVIAKS
ncbi:MAG TPA: GrpB family protein [Bryobacteraceae bacterium]|nr:GrpB family protein [Bryobacteraceae bacterium]